MTRIATLAGLCAMVVLAGCGSSGSDRPRDVADVARLKPGACRQAAPVVNSIQRQVADQTADDAFLSRGQNDLRNLPVTEAGVAVARDDLVTSIGYLRLGLGLRSGGGVDDVNAAAEQLVAACRA